jgi:AhpD family alkylhydroperoxidase
MSAEGQRLSVAEVDPAAYQAVLGLEKYIHSGTLAASLLDLVKIRASQLNGCAYCLDMHNSEARQRGESQRRLDILSAWREAPTQFTDQERAAIELTEQVTRIGEAGVSDEVWARAAEHFSQPELVRLLIAIATINVWNRMAVSTRQALPDPAGRK